MGVYYHLINKECMEYKRTFTDKDIVDHFIKIIGNGTFRVETFNEAVLVKMLELRGTPIPLEKSGRNINIDWDEYLKDKN
jgi:hypothetical protein